MEVSDVQIPALRSMSGGKAIGGPQSTGILAGKRDLVASALLQQLDMDVVPQRWSAPDFVDRAKVPVPPHHGIGRGFKVGKEEIVGLLVALERFAATDDLARLRSTEARLQKIADALAGTDARIVAGKVPVLEFSVGDATATLARLAAHDRRQRIALFRVGLAIDEKAHAPVPLDHVAGRLSDDDEPEPVELRAVEAAAIDVERHGERAGPVSGLLEPAGRAGAEEVAVAGLHVPSGNVPRHGVLPSFRVSLSRPGQHQNSQPTPARSRRPGAGVRNTSLTKVETTPDMWVHWVSTYFADPENWIGQMYDSQFHGTWKASSWYKNDKVDAMLREAVSSGKVAETLIDPETKKRLAEPTR